MHDAAVACVPPNRPGQLIKGALEGRGGGGGGNRVRVKVRVRVRGVKAADIRESNIHVFDVYGHGVCVQVRRVFAG